jgi:hypothetical protein
LIIEAYKRCDGLALESDKIGEFSGERGQKIGDIQAPPKTFHKNAYAPKTNPLRNRLVLTLTSIVTRFISPATTPES